MSESITVPTPPPLNLDLGCGKAKKPGFLGVDRIKFDGVDVVLDIGVDPWPWADGTVDEIHCSHVLEHLVPEQRIHFVNEAHRVLKTGGRCAIFVPHWNSPRAYGDLTHVWPPVTEFWMPYLDKAWRAENAPHESRYTCDFACTVPGYSIRGDLRLRSPEVQQFALTNYKGAAEDMMAALIKKGALP